MPMVSHYKVLGIQPAASVVEVRAAFKHRALLLHPDKGGSKEAFQRALLAFEVLSDSASRSAYDNELQVKIQGGVRMHIEKLEKPSSHTSVFISNGRISCLGCKRKADHGKTGERDDAAKMKKCRVQSSSQQSSARDPQAKKSGSHRTVTGPSLLRAGLCGSHRCQTMTNTRTNRARQSGSSTAASGFADDHFRRSGRATKKPEHKMNMLLGRIFLLMQRLSPQGRWQALKRSFTQQQRLALEKWARHPNRSHKADHYYINAATRRPTSAHNARQTVIGTFHALGRRTRGDELEQGAVLHPSVGAWPLAICDIAKAEQSTLHWSMKHEQGVDSSLAMNVLFARGSVCGVAWKLRRSKPYYQANVCVETLYLVSREVPELDTALDALVILTAMKQGILKCRGCNFENTVRRVVPQVLQDHGISAEQLGLGFHIMISMRFWINPPLHTPQQRSLEVALSSWSRLEPFRAMTRAGLARELARKNPLELQRVWQEFRETYLDILEAHGKCRTRNSVRLDALEKAAQPVRERRLERWNRIHMSTEDRLQHWPRRAVAASRATELQSFRERREERKNQKAMAVEARRLRLLHQAELRGERRETRAMAQEDVQSRAQRRLELKEACSLRRIARLLRNWQSLHRRLEKCQARLQRGVVHTKLGSGRAGTKFVQAPIEHGTNPLRMCSARIARAQQKTVIREPGQPIRSTSLSHQWVRSKLRTASRLPFATLPGVQ